jgi:hypothetical protein
MKKIFALLVLTFFLFSGVSAQGNSGKDKNKSDKNVSKGKTNTPKGKGPPPWAPAHGYKKRHVYFPDHKTYYDQNEGVYIYYSNGNWTLSVEVPIHLKNVDLKLAAKVEIDMDDTDKPQVKFSEHLKLYPPKK